MPHNSNCADATKTSASKCECSCNGAKHPRGAGTSTSNSDSGITKEDIRESSKTVGKNAVMFGVASTNPQLATAYAAYTTGKAGKQIYDAWNKSESSEKFSNVIEETKEQGVTIAAKEATDGTATQIANSLRNSVDDAGGLEYVSGKTGNQVDEDVFGTMLEGTTEETIKSSSAEVSKIALEAT